MHPKNVLEILDKCGVQTYEPATMIRLSYWNIVVHTRMHTTCIRKCTSATYMHGYVAIHLASIHIPCLHIHIVYAAYVQIT
jgi:hypothetical protein